MTAERWAARPRLAAVVRVAVLVLPVALAVAAGALTARLLSGRPYALRLLLVLAVTGAVLLLVERGARRLLPLETLLRLALLFPDRAPSRFQVALQAGSTRALAGRTDTADVAGLLVRIARHDRATRRHSERVRAYTDLLAEQLRLPAADRERLRWASLLHDVGKLEVEPTLLNKPSSLDEAEWERVRRHPEAGARLAEPLRAFLGDWFGAIGDHHERWDGTGYPQGLAGDKISLAGRIVAVADSFEVMTSDRPYRRSLDPATARTELVRCGSTQFDPNVVRALLDVSLDDLRKVLGPVALLAAVPLVGIHPDALLHPSAAAHSTAVPSGHDAAGHPALTGHGPTDGAGATAATDDR